MRKISFTLLLFFAATLFLFAHKPQVKTIKYQTIVNGKAQEGSRLIMVRCNDHSASSRSQSDEKLLPTVAREIGYIDYNQKRTWQVARFANDSLINTTSLFADYPNLTLTNEKETIAGYLCTKATTSLRSNAIEIWFTTEAGVKGTPSMAYGIPEGLVLRIVRNGNFELRATEITEESDKNSEPVIPNKLGKTVETPLYRHLITEQLITTIEIFNNEQISFGNEITNPEPDLSNVTYHFSEGTVILKKVKLPQADKEAQVFAELWQYSNGDAYDRTGTVFMIPTGKEKSFLEGLQQGVDQLPPFIARNGKAYQGVVATPQFDPLVEIMRFFTPFGIKQFNEQSKVYGQQWKDSAFYKQEVTDLMPLLEGECWIGAFIGNYDKGGHKVSLKLKYYPGSREIGDKPDKKYWIQPLFNTLNVMEMSGQEYGTMFGTDTLRAEFTIPEGVNNLRFRYITTGHGGWGNGDEFNQKANYILIDNELSFQYTPWRSDCATWRDLNPASGNFWNGLTSSDYSRSGWCPGTATQPVYFPVKPLKAGLHKVEVAIPQGANEGTSFSSWSVSGILIGDME